MIFMILMSAFKACTNCHLLGAGLNPLGSAIQKNTLKWINKQKHFPILDNIPLVINNL